MHPGAYRSVVGISCWSQQGSGVSEQERTKEGSHANPKLERLRLDTGCGVDSGLHAAGLGGVIDASFLIAKDKSHLFSFQAHTFANGTKTYVPGSDASIDASADFSHTLKWLGITGLHAFDSSGNEIPLPADASLPLIGRDTGFDYWHPADPSPVPLRSTLLFMCAGLIGAGPWLRRKRGKSRGSP